MSEDAIQMEVVRRLRAAGRCAFFHVANERRTTPRQGAKLKAMGVSAGVPDLVIVTGGRTYALELKSERGRLSDAQKNWLNILSATGCWHTAVTYGLTEAVDQLTDWGLL